LERPVRDSVTPGVLEKVVWAGANLSSYGFSSDALKELAEVDLSTKQIHRITSQIGGDRVAERQEFVAEFAAKPLAERTSAKPGVRPPEVGVVMLDNGTHQRRGLDGSRQVDAPMSQSGCDSARNVFIKMKPNRHWRPYRPDLSGASMGWQP
jgi:hypothetical protein